MPSPTTALCQHAHTNGNRCGSPALRGEQFCYYHHPTRRPARRSSDVPLPEAFDLPAIVELEDVQIAIHEIMGRVANATLDVKRANLLLGCVDRAARCVRSGLSLEPGPDRT